MNRKAFPVGRHSAAAPVSREPSDLGPRAQRCLQTVSERAACHELGKVERRSLHHQTAPVQKALEKKRVRTSSDSVKTADLDEEAVASGGEEASVDVQGVCHEVVTLVRGFEGGLLARERDEVFLVRWCRRRRVEQLRVEKVASVLSTGMHAEAPVAQANRACGSVRDATLSGGRARQRSHTARVDGRVRDLPQSVVACRARHVANEARATREEDVRVPKRVRHLVAISASLAVQTVARAVHGHASAPPTAKTHGFPARERALARNRGRLNAAVGLCTSDASAPAVGSPRQHAANF